MNEQTLGEQDEGGKILTRYLKPDLLIIDDMGMKQLPGRSGEYLLEIIMRRHENRSTMMTSNPLEDWAKLIGDVPSATAILDRFLQHATIINFTGKSYRLKGRRSTADGERLSPPKDTAPVTAVSSEAKAPAPPAT
jgi:DNA replication protein DnaC